MAADEYAARFYSQDATPGGVLEVEGELSDTAWGRMKSQWNALHKGVAKAHELGILESRYRRNSSTDRRPSFTEPPEPLLEYHSARERFAPQASWRSPFVVK